MPAPSAKLLLFGSSGPSLPFPAPDSALDVDFIGNRAWLSGAPVTLGSQVTVTRPSIAWHDNAAGIWSSFANDVLRRTDRGTIVEETRTNVVLWNRDLTNAAWVRTSVTAAKDQVGVDGVAGSASSLVATGASGTVLQTTVIASSARFQSAFARRLVGTGNVDMTMDGGTTWTPVGLNPNWARVSVPSATLANPVVGFRFATSGDSIAVDMVQNENGAYATTPIDTGAAAVARATDFPVWPFSVVNIAAGTFFVDIAVDRHTANLTTIVYVNDGSANNRYQITTAGASTIGLTVYSGAGNQVGAFVPMIIGQRHRLAAGYAANDFAVIVDGAQNAIDTVGAVPLSLISPGRFSANPPANTGVWRIQRFAYWPVRLAAGDMQRITARALM